MQHQDRDAPEPAEPTETSAEELSAFEADLDAVDDALAAIDRGDLDAAESLVSALESGESDDGPVLPSDGGTGPGQGRETPGPG